MALIPTNINGVTVEFRSIVNRDVHQSVIDGLKHCIKPQIAAGHLLTKIYIYSASDSHSLPSRHAQNKAVDISRINGTHIIDGYGRGGAIKAIVDAIQGTFERYGNKRENFGPHLKKKSGQPWSIGKHRDHIHLSVN